MRARENARRTRRRSLLTSSQCLSCSLPRLLTTTERISGFCTRLMIFFLCLQHLPLTPPTTPTRGSASNRSSSVPGIVVAAAAGSDDKASRGAAMMMTTCHQGMQESEGGDGRRLRRRKGAEAAAAPAATAEGFFRTNEGTSGETTSGVIQQQQQQCSSSSSSSGESSVGSVGTQRNSSGSTVGGEEEYESVDSAGSSKSAAAEEADDLRAYRPFTRRFSSIIDETSRDGGPEGKKRSPSEAVKIAHETMEALREASATWARDIFRHSPLTRLGPKRKKRSASQGRQGGERGEKTGTPSQEKAVGARLRYPRNQTRQQARTHTSGRKENKGKQLWRQQQEQQKQKQEQQLARGRRATYEDEKTTVSKRRRSQSTVHWVSDNSEVSGSSEAQATSQRKRGGLYKNRFASPDSPSASGAAEKEYDSRATTEKGKKKAKMGERMWVSTDIDETCETEKDEEEEDKEDDETSGKEAPKQQGEDAPADLQTKEDREEYRKETTREKATEKSKLPQQHSVSVTSEALGEPSASPGHPSAVPGSAFTVDASSRRTETVATKSLSGGDQQQHSLMQQESPTQQPLRMQDLLRQQQQIVSTLLTQPNPPTQQQLLALQHLLTQQQRLTQQHPLTEQQYPATQQQYPPTEQQYPLTQQQHQQQQQESEQQQQQQQLEQQGDGQEDVFELQLLQSMQIPDELLDDDGAQLSEDFLNFIEPPFEDQEGEESAGSGRWSPLSAADQDSDITDPQDGSGAAELSGAGAEEGQTTSTATPHPYGGNEQPGSSSSAAGAACTVGYPQQRGDASADTASSATASLSSPDSPQLDPWGDVFSILRMEELPPRSSPSLGPAAAVAAESTRGTAPPAARRRSAQQEDEDEDELAEEDTEEVERTTRSKRLRRTPASPAAAATASAAASQTPQIVPVTTAKDRHATPVDAMLPGPVPTDSTSPSPPLTLQLVPLPSAFEPLFRVRVDPAAESQTSRRRRRFTQLQQQRMTSPTRGGQIGTLRWQGQQEEESEDDDTEGRHKYRPCMMSPMPMCGNFPWGPYLPYETMPQSRIANPLQPQKPWFVPPAPAGAPPATPSVPWMIPPLTSTPSSYWPAPGPSAQETFPWAVPPLTSAPLLQPQHQPTPAPSTAATPSWAIPPPLTPTTPVHPRQQQQQQPMTAQAPTRSPISWAMPSSLTTPTAMTAPTPSATTAIPWATPSPLKTTMPVPLQELLIAPPTHPLSVNGPPMTSIMQQRQPVRPSPLLTTPWEPHVATTSLQLPLQRQSGLLPHSTSSSSSGATMKPTTTYATDAYAGEHNAAQPTRPQRETDKRVPVAMATLEGVSFEVTSSPSPKRISNGNDGTSGSTLPLPSPARQQPTPTLEPQTIAEPEDPMQTREGSHSRRWSSVSCRGRSPQGVTSNSETQTVNLRSTSTARKWKRGNNDDCSGEGTCTDSGRGRRRRLKAVEEKEEQPKGNNNDKNNLETEIIAAGIPLLHHLGTDVQGNPLTTAETYSQDDEAALNRVDDSFNEGELLLKSVGCFRTVEKHFTARRAKYAPLVDREAPALGMREDEVLRLLFHAAWVACYSNVKKQQQLEQLVDGELTDKEELLLLRRTAETPTRFSRKQHLLTEEVIRRFAREHPTDDDTKVNGMLGIAYSILIIAGFFVCLLILHRYFYYYQRRRRRYEYDNNNKQQQQQQKMTDEITTSPRSRIELSHPHLHFLKLSTCRSTVSDMNTCGY